MRILLTFVFTLAFAGLAMAASAPVPLGHPDFYPSPDRPLGWRGDGTAAWPGANGVTAWNAETGQNIVWKTDTLGAGLCQPVVAGEKVFITADPNLLLCYNVQDGKLLWQTAIDHTLCMSEEDRQAARAEQAFFDGKWREYCEWKVALQKLEAGLLKVSGAGPAPDRKKDGKAFGQWEQVRNKVLGDLYVSTGQCKRLVQPGDPGHEAILKLAKDDAQTKGLFEQTVAAQQANGWRVLTACNGYLCALSNNKGETSAPFAPRYQQAQKKFNLWFSAGNNWLGYVTYSFATPVTDGKYVYVTTANNAVAAVDYTGKIAWIIWEYRPERGTGVMHTQYVPSPKLLDGKLVVNQMGLLRVYDAANGKKLWEVWGPSAVAHGKKPANYYYRGDPEAPTPVTGHLALPEGGRLAVVTEGNTNLWRLEDGKLLCHDLPSRGKSSTSILVGDLYAWVTDGDRQPDICGGVLRLRAESRDKVTWEHVWKSPDRLCGSTTPVVCDEKFFASPARSFDLLTGKPAGSFGSGMRWSNCSPIVAGPRIYSFSGRGGCCVAAVTGGTVSQVALAYLDERDQDGDFGLLNRYAGCGYQQNSSPSAQANRIFFRARGVLWCIGDKSQPFPVPKDCPPHARVAAQ